MAFLPQIYGEGAAPPVRWPESKGNEDVRRTVSSPEYSEGFRAFIRTIIDQGCWMTSSYSPPAATRMLRDETVIRTATLPEIQCMLTAVVRGERFSDGWWASMI